MRHVRKDERKYYEELLKYSRDHLMLYPYHLSDIMVKGLRVTPFSYYIGIMEVRGTHAAVERSDALFDLYHTFNPQLLTGCVFET